MGKIKEIFSVSVLVLCIAVFGLVIAASAEDSIEDIMISHYGSSWTESGITEITFAPQDYTVVTIVVDEHQAAYRDPTGWYSVADGSRHLLFWAPKSGDSTTFNPGEEFGLVIYSYDDGGIFYYSQQSRNLDGMVHARVFRVTGGVKSGSYVVAFEDLTDWTGAGEPDYNDVVVELTGEGLELIPEFATIALPAASILGLLFFFNYRKRRKE